MLESMIISGKDSLPIIEGGKGIAVSSGESSGAWAKLEVLEPFLESMLIHMM